MASKLKLVIFEGCDKVGKTTLFKAYRKATNYGPLAVDRFTGSNYVYDKYYNRETNLGDYVRAETAIQELFDCYLILLLAPPKVILARIEAGETGEAKEIALENYSRINGLFLDYFYLGVTRYKKVLLLDTSEDDIRTCLKKILEFTKEGAYDPL